MAIWEDSWRVYPLQPGFTQGTMLENILPFFIEDCLLKQSLISRGEG